jgi:hypothetical protein
MLKEQKNFFASWPDIGLQVRSLLGTKSPEK